MGLLSSSKSTSSPTQQSAGLSEIAGPASVLQLRGFGGKKSVNTITVTDAGAIQASRDLGLASLDLARRSQDSLEALHSAQAQSSRDAVSSAYSLANQARQSETSGAINNVLKYGALIAVAALIAWAVVKKG